MMGGVSPISTGFLLGLLIARNILQSRSSRVGESRLSDKYLNAPDGHDWDRLPMREITKMSRVTVYWPGQKVERSNKLSRVLELTLGLTTAQADAILNDPSRTASSTRKQFWGRYEKVSRSALCSTAYPSCCSFDQEVPRVTQRGFNSIGSLRDFSK
jgi:hypothetical protein